jgi:uncharacterized cofD-like protein
MPFERIAVIGGGAGPSLLARAFADRIDSLTAVVCTSDTGSSTGVCREAFGVPAPGDLRATLSVFAALSGHAAWSELWETRLRCEDIETLDGMALGNLLICGLFQRTGNFSEAIHRAGRLLGVRGRVFPVTTDTSQLEAELEDGTIVRGELEIRRPGKPPIRRLGWFGPQPKPAAGVLEALHGADLIVIGPGCLYTSILPCLGVEGIPSAIRDAQAISAYICNTTTTLGQTDGFAVARHVELIKDALNNRGPDAVIINDVEPPRETRSAYERLGLSILLPNDDDLRMIGKMGVKSISMPLIEEGKSRPRRLHKVDTVRHDPERVRASLEALAKICLARES